ncbi:MAG: hypothetical protein U0746_10230 [Gemmataceae bacterium]
MTPILRHTKGPWRNDTGFIVAPDPTGNHPDIYVAEVAREDDEGRVAWFDEQVANGYLIAAAPDLFALVGRLADGGTPVAQLIRDAQSLVAAVCEDPVLFVRPPSHADDEASDATLMQSIQNDPCISPADWPTAYRAATRGKPNWWLAVADDLEPTESPGGRSPAEATDAKPARGDTPAPSRKGAK